MDAGDPVELGDAIIITDGCDPSWIQIAGVAVGLCVIGSLDGDFAARSREPAPRRRPMRRRYVPGTACQQPL